MIRRIDSPFKFLLVLCVLAVAFSGIMDVNDAPSFTTSDAFQFFYLESSFPYNTPKAIKDAAGSSFLKYGISHAGLGMWDTTTDTKFSIEFVSNNYTGALFPTYQGDQIVWNNAGSIVITNPLVEDNWLNSRLVSTTTANAWSQMVTYLQDKIKNYDVYQPVSVVYANSSLYSNSSEVTTDDIEAVGGVTVYATNSFSFVDDMIKQLADYGCDLGAFLQIYATSYDYLAEQNVAPTVVSWDEGETNQEVYYWYHQLEQCYHNKFSDIQANGGGAEGFNAETKDCYGSVAYVYKSATSVYNVTLQVATTASDYSTPQLTQYIYNLPPSSGPGNETLAVIDYIMITLAFVALIAGVFYFIRKMFGKKERRRVSMEGEEAAARAVNDLVGLNEDMNHEENTYYNGGQRKGGIFGKWGAKSGATGSGVGKGSAIAKRGSYQDEEKGRDSNSLEKPLTSAQCRLTKSNSTASAEDVTPSLVTDESTV